VILVSQVEAMMNSVERVQYYSEPRDEEKWEADDPALSESVRGGGWPSRGHIVIRDLQLRYRANLDLVLKGVSLDLPAGRRIGIVGRTGSGQQALTASSPRSMPGS
jgi:ATP-binding cassette subfamily C (CFTR/MRP) protein 1